jgi:hypothetical protein
VASGDTNGWTEKIELTLKALTLVSLAAGGVWAVVTYRSTREAEFEQRNRELTKPFREAQLKLCEDVTSAAGTATADTFALMYSKASKALQDRYERERDESKAEKARRDKSASTLNSEVARIRASLEHPAVRAVMLGDEQISELLYKESEVVARCGRWAYQPRPYKLMTTAEFEYRPLNEPRRKLEVRPNACLLCLQYLSLRTSERCATIVKAWWPNTEASSNQSAAPSDTRWKELSKDEQFFCEHAGEIEYWGE